MQSIIVYRNPAEAAFWEFVTSGSFFPIIVGVVAFFAIFLLVQRVVIDRFFRWNNNATPTNINLMLSGVIGVFIIWYIG